MKTKLLWVLILLAQTFYAQEITGTWKGELDLGSMKLPLILNIKKENNALHSVAKSPKQSDKDIPVDRTEFINNELTFEIKNLDASYKGKFLTDHFEGLFTQNGHSLPLNLYQNETHKSAETVIAPIGKRTINTAKIDDFLDYITKNKQSVGSLSIFRNGKEIYQRSFGQDQLPEAGWNAKTAYQVGSISKLFTAVMLMQLEEKGKLKLNDKLSKYYPDIPNADKITIKNMMNHTSGLGDYVGADYQWLFKKPAGHQTILDTIKAQGVEFQPGEKTRYSNSGYYLLSRILETITNMPYNQLLKENITSRLGMTRTFSVLDHPQNVFKPYEKKNGKWTEMEDFDFVNCIGLGDISSTPTDLNIFLNGLFGNRLLKKETLQKMLPDLKKPREFGLGMMMIPFYNQFSYGHGGDTAGSHSVAAFNPDDQYSLAMTINGEELPHNQMAIFINNIIYDKPFEYPKFETENKETDSAFQKYIGDYQSDEIPIGLKVFAKDHQLFAQGKGQPEFPLNLISADQFGFEKAGIVIEFFPEKNQMQLKQNDKVYHFKKE